MINWVHIFFIFLSTFLFSFHYLSCKMVRICLCAFFVLFGTTSGFHLCLWNCLRKHQTKDCDHCIMLQIEWSFYICIEGTGKYCLLLYLLCLTYNFFYYPYEKKINFQQLFKLLVLSKSRVFTLIIYLGATSIYCCLHDIFVLKNRKCLCAPSESILSGTPSYVHTITDL